MMKKELHLLIDCIGLCFVLMFQEVQAGEPEALLSGTGSGKGFTVTKLLEKQPAGIFPLAGLVSSKPCIDADAVQSAALPEYAKPGLINNLMQPGLQKPGLIQDVVKSSPVPDFLQPGIPQGSYKTGIKKPPSQAAAFALSLALPGAGEYVCGSRRMASMFFGSEVLIWSAFASLRFYGHWREEDYQQYAAIHAGVNTEGKDRDYFVSIENYDNIRDYNEAKLRQRNVEALYPENAIYNWDWDRESSRLEYEKLRISSDRAYDTSKIVVGLVVVNHIMSAVDALRASRAANKAYERRLEIGFEELPEGGAKLTVLRRF